MTINLWAFGLEAPRRVQAHQRGSLRLQLINVLTTHLIQLTLVLINLQFSGLYHVLLGGFLLIEHLVLSLECSFGHEVVLA